MQFRQLRTVLCAAAMALTGVTAHAADSWCAQGKTVHFAGITWESGSFATEVLRQILEKGYGCKTDVVPGSTAATETALAHNDVQVWAEQWTGRSEITAKAVASGSVKLVGDTGQALGGIVAKVGEIDALIGEIAKSSQEQALGLSQVNTSVNQMDQVTQQNAAMVEEATAAAASLKAEAMDLANLVSRFDGGGRASARLEVARPGRHAPARNPVGQAQAKIAASMRARPAASGGDWQEF